MIHTEFVCRVSTLSVQLMTFELTRNNDSCMCALDLRWRVWKHRRLKLLPMILYSCIYLLTVA